MADGNATDWLPAGSVVRLRGGDRPVVVCGHMQREGASGTLWDYLAYPWPECRADAGRDWFFDAADVDAVLFAGYEGDGWDAYLDVLRRFEPEYRAEKERSASRAGDLPRG